jgi:bla regulator protein blaR1
MRHHAECKRDPRKGIFATTASVVALAVLLIVVLFTASQLSAKLATAQTPIQPATQPPTQPTTPQWQIDAGGKMTFDVASVKPDNAAPSQQTVSSNMPISATDALKPTGGLFSAKNYPLFLYIVFAYKLPSSQANALFTALPKWANTTRYDIEAHAAAGMNPTKDQYRLMMQALLADRFKLAIHYEIKQLPVVALVLDKPGKLGPKIQQHPADQPCSRVPVSLGSPVPATTAEGFPMTCGVFIVWFDAGRMHAGARDLDLQMMASNMTNPGLYGIDRPVLDKTGLTGRYDLVFDFTPTLTGPLPAGSPQFDESGPTFQEALKAQIGFKLEPQTGPVNVFVVDHVEEPSAN